MEKEEYEKKRKQRKKKKKRRNTRLPSSIDVKAVLKSNRINETGRNI